MTVHICIHAHFYQPPRDNPWLDHIEREDSAAPYHDWNERITRECYAPNAASRILDEQGRICDVLSNYERISFNFGPTLLRWMERMDQTTYQAIIEADRRSQRRFSGHGSAIAQAYSHPILPLATDRDRRTQVLWGLADFQHRFGRRAESMWLPETAVDGSTLELLAEQGLSYAILAPRQAAAIRPLGAGSTDWIEVTESNLDTTRPYRCNLPSGRSIALFFYDGRLSQKVAFGGLLRDGAALAKSLVHAADDKDSARDPLVHIATDGETYGHHHRFGDMALAFALRRIEQDPNVRLTNYAEYLETHPPEWEVRIAEPTSWSCSHGVERWRGDCGCNSGAHPGWNQAWRGPLRRAQDEAAAFLAELFEKEAGPLVHDPWAARDEYVEVVLDPTRRDAFIERHAARPLSAADRIVLLQLFESQRHALLMFASCGWFFDDIAGLEAVQIMRLASRAMHLAQLATGRDFESRYVEILAQTRPNDQEYATGAELYQRLVASHRWDLPMLVAHHAVHTVLDGRSRAEPERLYGYDIEPLESHVARAGLLSLVLGRDRVTCSVTEAWVDVDYGLLHLGGHNFYGGLQGAGFGVSTQGGAGPGESQWEEKVQDAFQRSDVADIIDLIRQRYAEGRFDLWDLFRDEQRAVLQTVLADTLDDMETALRRIHDRHAPLMQLIGRRGIPLPEVFATAARFLVRADLRRALEARDLEALRVLAEEERSLHLAPADPELELLAAHAAERICERACQDDDAPGGGSELGTLPGQIPEGRRDGNVEVMGSRLGAEARTELAAFLDLFERLGLQPDLWFVQNRMFSFLRGLEGARWTQTERDLAHRLFLAVGPERSDSLAGNSSPKESGGPPNSPSATPQS